MVKPVQSEKSLRIFRRPIPTDALDEFFDQIEERSMAIYRPDRTYPVSQDTGYEFAAEVLRMKPVRKIKTYRPEYLKILLLDRRMPSEDYNKLARVYRRFIGTPRSHADRDEWLKGMSDAAEKRGFSPDELIPIKFRSSTLTLTPSVNKTGLEVSLIPEIDNNSLLLMDEMAVCWNSLQGIHKQLAYPAPKTILQMPILRLPAESTTEQVRDFKAMVDSTLGQQALRLSFMEPTPDL